MKKIRLDLDQLAVESFATDRDGGAEAGTVRGHQFGGSGVGCASYGCDSSQRLEQCICENQFNPETAPPVCG